MVFFKELIGYWNSFVIKQRAIYKSQYINVYIIIIVCFTLNAKQSKPVKTVLPKLFESLRPMIKGT